VARVISEHELRPNEAGTDVEARTVGAKFRPGLEVYNLLFEMGVFKN
jgi:hypothetical protein